MSLDPLVNRKLKELKLSSEEVKPELVPRFPYNATQIDVEGLGIDTDPPIDKEETP